MPDRCSVVLSIRYEVHMYFKYRRAAARPWLPVDPDPPVPPLDPLSPLARGGGGMVNCERKSLNTCRLSLIVRLSESRHSQRDNRPGQMLSVLRYVERIV